MAGRALTVGLGVAHPEIGPSLLSPVQELVLLGARSRVGAWGSRGSDQETCWVRYRYGDGGPAWVTVGAEVARGNLLPGGQPWWDCCARRTCLWRMRGSHSLGLLTPCAGLAPVAERCMTAFSSQAKL